MKVLQVIPSVGPQRGGSSVWLRSMASGVAAAGLDVHVATTDDDGPDRMPVPLDKPRVEGGVTYWYFPRQTRFYTFSFPLSTWLARHIREFDLVHIHALFSYAALPAAFWARRSGVPYIVQPHGSLCRWGMQSRRPLLKRCSFRWIERRILEGSAAVDFTDRSEMREASDLGDRWRPVVIPLGTEVVGADTDRLRGRFRARMKLSGRRMVLYFSRFDPKKGIDLLLPAFARVRQACADAVLVMAGSGTPEYEEELRAAAARLGLGADVIWAGFLQGEEKLAALADADVFVLPSYSENFGIAVVEALAAGTPVVVSENVGIHAEVREAAAGLVVPCDAGALAEALVRMLRDDGLRATAGANARALAARQFAMKPVIGRLVELYRTASGTR